MMQQYMNMFEVWTANDCDIRHVAVLGRRFTPS